MAVKLKRIAERYVQEQISNFEGQVVHRVEVRRAVNKVTEALREIRETAATYGSGSSRENQPLQESRRGR